MHKIPFCHCTFASRAWSVATLITCKCAGRKLEALPLFLKRARAYCELPSFWFLAAQSQLHVLECLGN